MRGVGLDRSEPLEDTTDERCVFVDSAGDCVLCLERLMLGDDATGGDIAA